jgi:adenylate cyclase class 2
MNGSASGSAGKVLLNYKHFYPEGAEHHTHCREIEVEVAAAGPAVRLLEALGFELVVTVRKVREQYRVDGFEIGLDEVDGLGHFVEIEALHDHGGIAKTRAAVEAFSHQLGVDLSRTDPRGYPYRLLRAKGLL